ncbi:SIS domain-containing protein [Mitsuaria sp. WAJ17]|uniref:SIS domain-containing protein n=1 Tax=Mitsuaria sp. WAJ17 TaxID=2761452 RepID=UPI001600D0FF|nr:SIS domain-containing protein [Mitsuaria sp. WAJ17]MBB2487633.1 SIS domain-containing protein [Mitsuaria sp. WAJ17]
MSVTPCLPGQGLVNELGLLFHRQLQEHQSVFHELHRQQVLVGQIGRQLGAVLRAGHTLLLFGNGGSAADCQHLAAELSGRFQRERRPLAALALTTDSSVLTSVANDYGYDEVFARQVAALGRPGDCAIGISTSGKSRSVLRALAAARSAGLHTVGLAGRDGGYMPSFCDQCIVVPHEDTARIQEAHIFIGHVLCAQIEHCLGLAGALPAAC